MKINPVDNAPSTQPFARPPVVFHDRGVRGQAPVLRQRPDTQAQAQAQNQVINRVGDHSGVRILCFLPPIPNSGK